MPEELQVDSQPAPLSARAEIIMATGPKTASKASKELSSKKSTATEKSVAASDLSQAKGKKGGKK